MTGALRGGLFVFLPWIPEPSSADQWSTAALFPIGSEESKLLMVADVSSKFTPIHWGLRLAKLAKSHRPLGINARLAVIFFQATTSISVIPAKAGIQARS